MRTTHRPFRLPVSLLLMAAAVLNACGGDRPVPVPESAEETTPTLPPPPRGLQGLVSDMQLYLQGFTDLARQDPAAARSLALEVYLMHHEPLRRYYGDPSAPGVERSVASSVQESDDLFQALLDAVREDPLPNVERIGAIMASLERKLEDILRAAEATGLRPPG